MFLLISRYNLVFSTDWAFLFIKKKKINQALVHPPFDETNEKDWKEMRKGGGKKKGRKRNESTFGSMRIYFLACKRNPTYSLYVARTHGTLTRPGLFGSPATRHDREARLFLANWFFYPGLTITGFLFCDAPQMFAPVA